MIRALADVRDPASFGGKAAALGVAVRAGLPVPPGFAVSWELVRDLDGRADPEPPVAIRSACASARRWAVRSSALDEDSGAASFAGAHLSLLGVSGADAVVEAIRQVSASGRAAGALAYRARLGVESTSRMAVVVQELVDADVAGVLFTRNPVSGADERVIEASWGLGETVVGGLVVPDRYRLDRRGWLLERQLGEKDVAVRGVGVTGSEQVTVAPELVGAPCLDEGNLTALHLLAAACDRAYGCTEHDIEFAFAGGAVFLLQRRPITGG